jgi:phage terminase Nu1 subunit (DNA packaging protein)
VIPLNRATGLVTKAEVARYLGRSTRWVELRVNEGMPSIAPTGRFRNRRFRIAEVEAWLADGRAVAKPPSLGQQVRELAARVGYLEATIGIEERR